MIDPKQVLVVGAVLAIGAALATRSSEPLKAPESWQKTMAAPIEPGVGVGDLVLGETTLRACMDRHGKGSYSVIASDDAIIELTYLRGQILLQFQLEPADDGVRLFEMLRDSTRDPMNFVASHPDVGSAPLTFIRIKAGSTPASTYFQGACGGCQLHQPAQLLSIPGLAEKGGAATLAPGTEKKYSGSGVGILVSSPRGSGEPPWLKRITIYAAK